MTEQLPEADCNTDKIPSLGYVTKIEFVHVNARLSQQRIVNFIRKKIINTRQFGQPKSFPGIWLHSWKKRLPFFTFTNVQKFKLRLRNSHTVGKTFQ